MQEWLDAGMGACHMRRSDVRAQVELCLLQFDGKRYDIDAFVLMPNHVHAVIKPTLGYDLSTLLQGIKGISANRCNKMLGSKSTFRMDESYDHIVRDAKELAVFRNYIAGNPAKAGLRADEYSLQLRNVLMPCLRHLPALSMLADRIVCATRSDIQKHRRLPSVVLFFNGEIMQCDRLNVGALMMPRRVQRFARGFGF
jgi:REP element-mobilizing transposase RayT